MIALICIILFVGVIYLFKRFLDNYGKLLPSTILGSFVGKCKEIESTGDGEIRVNRFGRFNVITIKKGDFIDSISVDISGSRIYSGIVKDDKPYWGDILVPMNLPIGSNLSGIDEIRELEDMLVGDIMDILVKYGNN